MRLCSREWELPIATSLFKTLIFSQRSVTGDNAVGGGGGREGGGQRDLMIKWRQEGILERMPAFECYVKWTMPLAEAYVPSVWDGQRRSCVTNGCHVLLFAEMGGKGLWRTCPQRIKDMLAKVYMPEKRILCSFVSPLTLKCSSVTEALR